MDSFEQSPTARNPNFSGIDYLIFWGHGKFKKVRASDPTDPTIERDAWKRCVDAALLDDRKRLERELHRAEHWPENGRAPGGLFDLLDYYQAIARTSVRGFSSVRLGGVRFDVYPNGMGQPGTHYCVYRLEVLGGITIGICSERFHDREECPKLRIEVKGEFLTQYGHKRAIEVIRKVYQCLGFECESSKLSRIDLRVDFTEFTPHQVHELCMERLFVTRAKHFPLHFGEGYQCQTFAVGKRGKKSSGIFLRVYDKLAQAASERKLAGLAAVLGDEEVDTLTRVEFEITRSAIRKRFNCDTLEDTLGQLDVICNYLVRGFFRLQQKVDRANTSRGKIHAIWERVIEGFQAFASRFDSYEPKPAEVKRQEAPEIRGVLTGYFAKMAAVLCPGEVWTFHKLRSFFESQLMPCREAELHIVRKIRDAESKLAEDRFQECMDFFANVNKAQRNLFALE